MEKFIDVILDSILQLLVVTFSIVREEHHDSLERVLKYPSLVQQHINVRPDCLCVLQLKQYFATY
jgi:hypothetical protein